MTANGNKFLAGLVVNITEEVKKVILFKSF